MQSLHFRCQTFLQSITFTLSTQRQEIFYWTGFIEEDHVAHTVDNT